MVFDGIWKWLFILFKRKGILNKWENFKSIIYLNTSKSMALKYDTIKAIKTNLNNIAKDLPLSSVDGDMKKYNIEWDRFPSLVHFF